MRRDRRCRSYRSYQANQVGLVAHRIISHRPKMERHRCAEKQAYIDERNRVQIVSLPHRCLDVKLFGWARTYYRDYVEDSRDASSPLSQKGALSASMSHY